MSDYERVAWEALEAGATDPETGLLVHLIGRTVERTDMALVISAVEPLIRADERAHDRAQRKALARLLLDSGDITPLAARMITKSRTGSDDD